MPDIAREGSPRTLPTRDTVPAETLAALAKALAHPARIQIVQLLLEKRTCIGCDIVEEIRLAQSTTSEHLRILKAGGVVCGEIERPRVCYSLNPSSVRPLAALLNAILEKPPERQACEPDCCP